MKTLTRMLAGAAAVAALAGAASPASAQTYGYPYGYSYPQTYGYPYNGYNNGNIVGQIVNSVIGNNAYAYSADTQAQLDRCAAAVEQRLNTAYSPYGGYGYGYGSAQAYGRVVGIHSIERTSTGLRIRGVASDGRTAAYSPYANPNTPNLTFKCDIDYRGYVRDIDLGANTNYTYNWTPYQRRY